MTRWLDPHPVNIPASFTNLDLPPLIALLISLMAVLAVFWISDHVYERIPHVEDEFAYIWQAQVFARGQAFLPSPPHPKLLVVPFVVDYHGVRFSKYPPGWSLLLSLGILTGTASWVNSILAGLAIWLTFRLGQKIFDDPTALLAAGLMVTSPFFLLHSAEMGSHPWSLVLCLFLTISWLDLFFENKKATHPVNAPAWIKVWVAGLSLGLLALTRPLTAIGVGIPFFMHGLTLLWRGEHTIRKQILSIGLITITIAALLPLWQYLLTGNLFQNLYALWWSYDRIGFGERIGTQPGGYNNLFWAFNNLGLSLIEASYDVFGWKGLSWLFIPFGLWAVRGNKLIELVIGIPAGLMLAYTIYWIGGARYYYEGLLSACLLSAAGILWLNNQSKKFGVLRAVIPLLILLLIGYNLTMYLPVRFDSMLNLYPISRAQQAPFMTNKAMAQTPALVIVHAYKWTDCAGLLPLQNPWLTTPFIFACDLSNSTETIGANDYPGRRILHYYPDKMEILSTPKE
jgi:hypothetical protein